MNTEITDVGVTIRHAGHGSGHGAGGWPERNLPHNSLVYRVHGRLDFRVGRTAFTSEPGDIILIPARTPCRAKAVAVQENESYWIGFHGAHAEVLLQAAGLGEQTPYVRTGGDETLLRPFRRIHRILRERSKHHPFAAIQQLTWLLFELAGRRVRPPRGGSPLLAAVSHDVASIDECASRAGMSKYHFCRRFRKEVGISPWRYVMSLKIDRAIELLTDTRLSIKEIGYRLGFSHPSRFAEAFRKSTGATPSEYRRHMKSM